MEEKKTETKMKKLKDQMEMERDRENLVAFISFSLLFDDVLLFLVRFSRWSGVV